MIYRDSIGIPKKKGGTGHRISEDPQETSISLEPGAGSYRLCGEVAREQLWRLSVPWWLTIQTHSRNPFGKLGRLEGSVKLGVFFFLVETKYLYKDPGDIYVMLDL